MPENAEVALTGEMISGLFCGLYLMQVRVTGGRYSRSPLPGLNAANKLMPFRLQSVKTHGKFLWMVFDDLCTPATDIMLETRYYLANTLGLEGRWATQPIRHCSVCFKFYDPQNREFKDLWWADQRNFGTLVFTPNSIDITRKVDKLAPDILLGDHTLNGLWTRFCGNRNATKWQTKPIVEYLMDQNALVSGIGNYLSAEILYEAGIDPASLVKTIGRGTFSMLYDAMRKVVAASYYGNCTRYIEHMVDHKPSRLPLKEFWTNDKFKFRVYQQKTVDGKGSNMVTGVRLLSTRDSLTYWCPQHQRLARDLEPKLVVDYSG